MYQKGDKELSVLSLYAGDYRKRFYLREIGNLCKLPIKTTQRILEAFEKNKILKSEIGGKNKYFFLNLENVETKSWLLKAETYKTLFFLKKYPQFKIFLKGIKNSNISIILFGSFAKFAANKDSDVDVFVVSGKKIELPYHLLSNEAHQIKISEENFKTALEKNETLLKKIEENHVILNNHSFFVNSMWDKYAK